MVLMSQFRQKKNQPTYTPSSQKPTGTGASKTSISLSDDSSPHFDFRIAKCLKTSNIHRRRRRRQIDKTRQIAGTPLRFTGEPSDPPNGSCIYRTGFCNSQAREQTPNKPNPEHRFGLAMA